MIEDRYMLVGITSFGAGCALPMKPGVYTRVTSVSNWITLNTGAQPSIPVVFDDNLDEFRDNRITDADIEADDNNDEDSDAEDNTNEVK